MPSSSSLGDLRNESRPKRSYAIEIEQVEPTMSFRYTRTILFASLISLLAIAGTGVGIYFLMQDESSDESALNNHCLDRICQNHTILD